MSAQNKTLTENGEEIGEDVMNIIRNLSDIDKFKEFMFDLAVKDITICDFYGVLNWMAIQCGKYHNTTIFEVAVMGADAALKMFQNFTAKMSENTEETLERERVSIEQAEEQLKKQKESQSQNIEEKEKQKEKVKKEKKEKQSQNIREREAKRKSEKGEKRKAQEREKRKKGKKR